jgi:hypothetical protein
MCDVVNFVKCPLLSKLFSEGTNISIGVPKHEAKYIVNQTYVDHEAIITLPFIGYQN